MTADETALALTLGSAALAGLVRPLLKRAFPKQKWGHAKTQPIALATAAAAVLGWSAAQPGPMDWYTIVPQVAVAWALANSRTVAAAATKPKT